MTTASAAMAEADPFAEQAVFARVAARLPKRLALEGLDPTVVPRDGDQSLNDWDVPAAFLAKTRLAAVLVGLVSRPTGVSVLLTQRTAGLRDHAGQIAFPGGKVDAGDASPAAAAIREAQEEIGLPADRVEVLGYLDPYLTRTGFRIVPVVARITPPFALSINPAEVADIFEVPFAFVMTAANHSLQHREWLGCQRAFYAITHAERVIWGVTAGILRLLYEKLYL